MVILNLELIKIRRFDAGNILYVTTLLGGSEIRFLMTNPYKTLEDKKVPGAGVPPHLGFEPATFRGCFEPSPDLASSLGL